MDGTRDTEKKKMGIEKCARDIIRNKTQTGSASSRRERNHYPNISTYTARQIMHKILVESTTISKIEKSLTAQRSANFFFKRGKYYISEYKARAGKK